MYETILVAREGYGILVTLNRPAQMNALSRTLLRELSQALKEAEDNSEIRSIIISGAEKYFCAGADIGEVNQVKSPFAGYTHSKEFQKLFSEMEALKKPIIAAVRGLALGGGLELMLACDFRLVAEDARLGLPEVNIGALPAGGGTVKLPRIVGAAKAKEMLFLGETITGRQAVEIGLVNKAVPADQVLDEARTLARRLAEKPPLVLQVIKAVIRASAAVDQQTAMDIEAKGLAMLASTEDFAEGSAAFLEKRKPNFRGR
ncbi:MAG: enoyl-CoA hydratase/isomerase family protein [Clostridia bacterium]|nr:MAG: enoyl-CoA hydratase/isomerase family protein [Clostridia bacterium]